MQGSGLARDGSPSEPISVAHAEAIESLVVAARITVRHMLEVDRNAVVGIEAIADFGRDMEQCAAAERLAIESVGFKVTVVHGDAKAEAEVEARRRIDLPASVHIALAGITFGVNATANRRAYRTAQERQRWRQNQFAIDIDAALQPEAAPQIRHVVRQDTELGLIDVRRLRAGTIRADDEYSGN